jgi:hypothetical protein
MPKQGKQAKDNKSSSDDRDINRSPRREIPKERSDQANKIIELLKKVDQKTMAHSNSESYQKYLITVTKRLTTYNEEDTDKFIDYENKKAEAEKAKEKAKRKSSRHK